MTVADLSMRAISSLPELVRKGSTWLSPSADSPGTRNQAVARALIAAALALVASAYRYLSFVDFGNDHFVHLAEAQQITRGLLPVRDFVERGMPLMSMLSAAAQVSLGEGLRAEALLVAAAFGLSAGLTFVLAAQMSGSVFVALVLTLASVLVYPATYGYPKLLVYVLAFLAGMSYCSRPSLPQAVLLAFTIAVALLFRHDHGIVLGVAAIALIVTRHGFTRESAIATARVLAVTLLIVSPYLIWIQLYQGVGGYLRDGIAFSRREAERGDSWWQTPRFELDRSRPLFARLGHGPIVNVRWKPEVSDEAVMLGEARHGLTRLDPIGTRSWQYELRVWSITHIERLVKDPAVADTHGIDRGTYRLRVPAPGVLSALLLRFSGPGEGMRLRSNAVAGIFYLVWLVPLAAAAWLARMWKTSDPATRALAVMIIMAQLLMNVTMIRDPLDTRIRDVLLPSLVLMSLIAGFVWRGPNEVAARFAVRALVVLVLLIVVGAAGVVGEVSERLDVMNAHEGVSGVRKRMRTMRRALLPPDERTGTLSPSYQSLVEYIVDCTPATSRVLALTFAPELFFYSGRAFAGGQVTLTPGYFTSDRDVSLMLERLAKEDVPLVIMDNETKAEVAIGYPRVVDYVSRRYSQIGHFPVTGDKEFIVFADDTRVVSKRFRSQQLPCFTR